MTDDPHGTPAKMLPGCAEAFGKISAQNESTAEKIDAMREDIGAQVCRLFTVLEGNGKPGLIVRVDRLEQEKQGEHKRSGRALSTLAVAVSAISTLIAAAALVYAVSYG